MLAVSSAWLKLNATKLIAPEVVDLVGLRQLERRHQRRKVGEIAGDHFDERHLLDQVRDARVVLALDHAEHVVALLVQELGEVLAVLASDSGDERAGHVRDSSGRDIRTGRVYGHEPPEPSRSASTEIADVTFGAASGEPLP